MEQEYFDFTKEEYQLLKGHKIDSTFDPNFNILTFSQYYQALEYVSEPFIIFEYRFGSLNRYLEYSKRYCDEYIATTNEYLKKLLFNRDSSAEEYDIHSEIGLPDTEYFSEYNYSSILSMLTTILENFIVQISKEIASEKNVKYAIKNRKDPIINKHLDFLCDSCNLKVDIEPVLLINLDLIRTVRNKYIHNIDGTFTNRVLSKLKKYHPHSFRNNNFTLDYLFMDHSFETIGSFVKRIEISCAKE
ncbi:MULTISPECIES: hypothetical protein [unclassified Paenibacillus]|uniref:hypothetical protein n=1 Tax=unclassified Paenibacillus TaxID=185978 RepID=UPI003838CC3F